LDTRYEDLDLDDAEDHPVQVTDEEGRVVFVSKGLQAVSGTRSPGVSPVPSASVGATASPDDDDDDDDDDDGDDGGRPARGEVSSDDPDLSDGTATVDGKHADYRFAAVEATTSAGITLTVHAGAPARPPSRRPSTPYGGAMLTGLPVLLAVVAGVTWLVTRRALRPVEGIRREMAAITASEDLA
ncbi:two-component sensor histidine kinase, partial [Streptomyces cavourensis]